MLSSKVSNFIVCGLGAIPPLSFKVWASELIERILTIGAEGAGVLFSIGAAGATGRGGIAGVGGKNGFGALDMFGSGGGTFIGRGGIAGGGEKDGRGIAFPDPKLDGKLEKNFGGIGAPPALAS